MPAIPNALIDIAHHEMPLDYSRMSKDIWKSKYAWDNEPSFFEGIHRIVNGVYAKDTGDTSKEHSNLAIRYMQEGLWMPAGRIMAGAGTDKLVTLLNCYVNGTIADNMKSIMQHVSYVALTMQQGGGVGTAFETIRPAGAKLKRTGKGSKASGPLPFMDMWNTAGVTIESAGARRGAQMGTISDTHPDMPAFVVAKRTPGRLTNFNVSVLVSDAFMEAIEEDAEWLLYFHVEPITRTEGTEDYDFVDDAGIQQYVYSVWRARDLWKLITENTYEYSEPGVIFIDRVNELNNLWYCEDIRATNPCGEQPLPPHNACDLGHVNLARMVKFPFHEDAYFDYDLLAATVAIGTRFLDNVLDVTNFPLEEQRIEVGNKRRIGLGYTGLADALAQLQLRYGGIKSGDTAERIMQTIAEAAYRTSIGLAIEKGSFPSFEAKKYISDHPSFVNTRMPKEIQGLIKKHGIRNGVLLTLAPTGTSSIVYGNASGGLEPFFALNTKRKVLQPDGSHVEYIEHPYAVNLYYQIFGEGAQLPAYFVTMKDLTIHDHIMIQSRTQRWVDASISKTINIPKETPYEEFVSVYKIAYTSGCKGCTTYRPSDVRGSVLEDASDQPQQQVGNGSNNPTNQSGVVVQGSSLRERPEVLQGATFKIKWPRRSSALYLTINSDENHVPFEVFITSKDGSAAEWTTSLSLMITAIMRKADGDIDFIADELQQIQSVNDGMWMTVDGKGKFFSSLPSYIGFLIGKHLDELKARRTPGLLPPGVYPATITGYTVSDEKITTEFKLDGTEHTFHSTMAIPAEFEDGMLCPECKVNAVHKVQGCEECANCGYSKCG